MKTVQFVVPAGIDDPDRPSGGNRYDRLLSGGLAAHGWAVLEHAAPGAWPSADAAGRGALGRHLAGIPDGQLLLIDGLVASTVPDLLVPQTRRLPVVVLLHAPVGQWSDCADTRAAERAVLAAASAVVTTSGWTRDWLLTHYQLPPDKVVTALPGSEPARLAPGTDRGGELICVAAVSRAKGHDVLVAALAGLDDLGWRCVCVGSLAREPAFVAQLRRSALAAGIADRIEFVGPQVGPALDRRYDAADLLVLPSRRETYGMVVTEASSRGLPVLASDVGGAPEAMGRLADGRRPGLLVPPADATALADAARGWLTDAQLRSRLRQAARQRRHDLPQWDCTVERVARVLAEVAVR